MRPLKLALIIMIVSLFTNSMFAQIPVLNLRSMDDYTILAGSTVTGIPPVTMSGHVGLSPAAGSYIAGFDGSNVVNGFLYVVDASGPAGSVIDPARLTTAKGDLTIAYNDAAGRTPVPTGPFLNPGSGNIGGLNLVAGLYKFTSTAAITGSNLTLTGSATDVWIFQIASSLNVGSGIQIILAGGAQAANIFWQVGTSATMGTYSTFKGTILADQSISFSTGATIEGRALAFSGAVTMGSGVTSIKPIRIVPPPAPILVTPLDSAINVSVNPVFTWNSSAGATSYTLQVAADTGFTDLIYDQGGLTSLSQQVYGLSNTTPYYWRVNAIGAGGTSDWSTDWLFTTTAGDPGVVVLKSPLNHAINIPRNSVLSWKKLSGADSYNMQLSKSFNFSTLVLNETVLLDTNYVLTSLDLDTVYYWRVKGVSAGVAGSWSTVWSFKTIKTASSAPVLLSPLNASRGNATNPILVWNASSGATSYQLQVATDIGFLNQIYNQNLLTTTYKQINDLAMNSVYYWRVNSIGAGGTSVWSTIWNFKTRSNSPFAFTLIPETNIPLKFPTEPINFKWHRAVDPDNDPIKYTLIIEGNGFSRIVTDIADTSRSLDIMDQLNTGSNYTWHVLATDGDNIVQSDSVSFTTSATITTPDAITAVNLGSTNSFVVLAGAAVTGVPPVALVGNVGLSPAAGSFVSGFDASKVNGILYVVDASGPMGSVQNAAILQTAKSDLTIAYNDAAGRTPVPTGYFLNPGSGNIGGLNLIPGLYKFTSNATITGGNLTLTGSATDVWIFQITSSLEVGAGMQVILAGDAQAENIFWQVGSSATLGANSAFKGTIMADQSITFGAGSTINGRALAFSGAVTLQPGVSATRSGLIDPSIAPILISPANNITNESTNPMMKWNPSIDAVSYILQISTNSQFTNLVYNQGELTTTSQQVVLGTNTLYYWRVNAVNAGGTSGWSTVWKFTTSAIISAPDAPVPFGPANTATGVATDPTFAWNPSQSATSYGLQVSTDPGFANIIKDLSGLTTPSQQVTGLNTNTLYYWRTNASNFTGTGSWSTIWSFTTLIRLPDAPVLTYPQANAIDIPMNVILYWETVTDALEYDVQFSKSSDFSNLLLSRTGLTTTNYSLNYLDPNSVYYWRVRARNNLGNSIWANGMFTTTQTSNIPVLISPSNNTRINSTDVVFMWSKIDNAVYYEMMLSKYHDFSINIINPKTLTNNTAMASGLDNNSTYYWKVKVNDGSNNWSQTFSFSTPSNIAAPILVFPQRNAYGISTTSLFKWEAVSDISNYELQISTDVNFDVIVTNYISIANVTQTVSNLTPNTTLYWRVRAVRDGDAGYWSEAWGFNTASTTLSIPIITYALDNSTNISINPTLKWSGVNEATGYEAIISAMPDMSTTLSIFVLGSPMVSIKNLAYNTSYYWKVLARKDQMTSGWTTIHKFTTHSIGVNVESIEGIADHFSLSQNYPNPFNPSTKITYTISEPSHVSIVIFNVFGQEIQTLVNENLPTGKYNTTWEPNNLTSGVYFYQLRAGKYNEVRKMMYIR